MQVNYGEHVRVVGSTVELGGWEVDTAPEMQWSEGHLWTGESLCFMTTKVVGLKLSLKDRADHLIPKHTLVVYTRCYPPNHLHCVCISKVGLIMCLCYIAATVELPANSQVQYKFVHVQPGQPPVWEFTPNRQLQVDCQSEGSFTMTELYQDTPGLPGLPIHQHTQQTPLL